MAFTLYGQRNPKWASIKIGTSSYTIGRAGCTLTCISMLSTYFGDNITPDKMVKALRFTPGGLLIWESVDFKHFKFWFRATRKNDTQIRNALADPNLAVILQVENGSHWVVATGLYNGGYKIADPWFGDRASTARYKNITGAAFFKRA